MEGRNYRASKMSGPADKWAGKRRGKTGTGGQAAATTVRERGSERKERKRERKDRMRKEKEE